MSNIMSPQGRILLLWNQVEEDIYETWREAGPQKLAWDTEREAPDVGTVKEEMEEFILAVREAGFHVDVVNIQDDISKLLGAIELFEPDAIFNLVEFFNDDADQEAYVAGLYEMLGYYYTGNRPTTLATCLNKFRTKLMLDAAEVPTSPYFLAKPGQPIPNPETLDLCFPLIVKPPYEDASGGISHDSVTHNQAEMEAQVHKIWKEYKTGALVEEYIEGREIHAAILGNSSPGNGSPEVLPLFEMEFDDSEFNPEEAWRPQIISFRGKWDPHSKDFYTMDAVCPAQDISLESELMIRQVALNAYKALGCRDYARIDMRFDEEEGEVYVLEVNPNPDLVNGAAYMMCATQSGRTFSQTLGEICHMAIRRGRASSEAPEQPDAASDQLLREWQKKQQDPKAETRIASGVPAVDSKQASDDLPEQLLPPTVDNIDGSINSSSTDVSEATSGGTVDC